MPFTQPHGDADARRGAPITRSGDETLRAALGPTNTGKTYFAIERMLSYPSGMIGLPLRLLAREVYDKVAARVGAPAAALVTGEEKIIPRGARYWISTVEAMPLERDVAFVAIDEAQLAGDPERGRIFTSRLLGARGTEETMFLGSATMRPILKRLFPSIDIVSRERFSQLTYAGEKKVTRLPRRSAVVGFSAETVYAVAELIRRQNGGAAVVLGALSPRTRNAQAALYQNGDVDYLVATDAIGMGLNMDIDHVAFAAKRKFDGRRPRDLRADELAQIAGRAGRHIRDGAFGVTGDCRAFDEDTVRAIEEHEFEPLAALQWRSDTLNFSSVPALRLSLNDPTPSDLFHRARPGEDEITLERLYGRVEIRERAAGPAAVALLWDVCQIPDFRKTAFDQHARLAAEIYEQLIDDGQVSEAWLAPKVAQLDRTDGDIDAISTRIAHVRTWTYLSNRGAWTENAAYWQGATRSIEDKLSDALHEKLTQRFVDRRTSVLMKKLRDDAPLLAGVTNDGEVIVEGQFVGRLIGFEFIIDPRARGAEGRPVRAAADRALAPVLAARAAALANAAPGELRLADDGVIWWRESPVATLVKGPAPLRPDIKMRGLDAISPSLRGRVRDRVADYFAARLEALLGDLLRLKTAADAPAPPPPEKKKEKAATENDAHGPANASNVDAETANEPSAANTNADTAGTADANAAPQPNGAAPSEKKSGAKSPTNDALSGLARGVAFRLVENFGAMSRAPIAADLKQLPQDERAKLRRLGVRFGEYTLYTPSLLKPAPAHLLTLLWSLWSGRDPADFEAPKPGLVSFPLDPDIPHAFYYACGYRPSGDRAVRIDMLERLAVQIRTARNAPENKDGFEVTQQMMSLIGCSGEEFESVLRSLGFRKHTVKRQRPAAATPALKSSEPAATPAPTGAAPTQNDGAAAPGGEQSNDAAASQASATGTDAPDMGAPDMGAPDLVAPDVVAPDKRQLEVVQTGAVQSDTPQSDMTQSATAQPGEEQATTGDSAAAAAASGAQDGAGPTDGADEPPKQAPAPASATAASQVEARDRPQIDAPAGEAQQASEITPIDTAPPMIEVDVEVWRTAPRQHGPRRQGKQPGRGGEGREARGGDNRDGGPQARERAGGRGRGGRSDERRADDRRPSGGRGQGANAGSGRRDDNGGRRDGGGKRREGGRFDRGNADRRPPARTYSAGGRKGREPDPNSPFAVLAALKGDAPKGEPPAKRNERGEASEDGADAQPSPPKSDANSS